MYWYKIELDTMSDINEFVNIAESLDCKAYIVDISNEFKVSARSFLGAVMAVSEWDELCLVSEIDVYTKFEKFIH